MSSGTSNFDTTTASKTLTNLKEYAPELGEYEHILNEAYNELEQISVKHDDCLQPHIKELINGGSVYIDYSIGNKKYLELINTIQTAVGEYSAVNNTGGGTIKHDGISGTPGPSDTQPDTDNNPIIEQRVVTPTPTPTPTTPTTAAPISGTTIPPKAPTEPNTEFTIKTEPRTGVPTPTNPTPSPSPAPGPGTGGGGYYSGTYTGGGSSVNPATTEVPTSSIAEDIIKKGNKYSKIPTSSKISTATTTTSDKGNSVIPVLAGLSAAAAAGIGAKAYLDRKKNRDNDDDDVASEDWSTDSDVDVTYSEPESEKIETLDFDDDGYETTEPEKYETRSNNEMFDMQ